MTASRTAVRAAVVAIGVLAADQATKALARSLLDRGESAELLLGISFVNVRNDGIAFGILGGNGALVLAITLLAVAGLGYYLVTQPVRPGQWLAVGLLVGGASGNLLDRLALGEVTDFIDLPAWPAFNVADIAITLGIAALVVIELRAEWRMRRAR